MYIEEWKDIPGWDGFYQVSNFGRVRSKKGIRKLNLTKDGYYQVQLNYKKKKQTINVHRLVWLAFNGEIPPNMEVNHIDENKLNNNLSNLNLLSHKDNMVWGTRIERLKDSMTNNPLKSKTVVQYDFDYNIVCTYPSISEASRITGYSIGNICWCCKGRSKQAYGYIWQYKEKEASVKN